MKRGKLIKEEVEQKGITLVALVVTIVIMLILVGITLNLALRENGLFKMSRSAVDSHKIEANKEEDILGKAEEELSNITNEILSEIPQKGPNGKTLVTSVTTLEHENIPAEDKLGNAVTVPGGFKVVVGETVEDGIVIEDKDENQFVWIPVSNIEPDKISGKKTQKIKTSKGEVEITLRKIHICKYCFEWRTSTSSIRLTIFFFWI